MLFRSYVKVYRRVNSSQSLNKKRTSLFGWWGRFFHWASHKCHQHWPIIFAFCCICLEDQDHFSWWINSHKSLLWYITSSPLSLFLLLKTAFLQMLFVLCHSLTNAEQPSQHRRGVDARSEDESMGSANHLQSGGDQECARWDGIFAKNTPKHTSIEDLWRVFKCIQDVPFFV